MQLKVKWPKSTVAKANVLKICGCRHLMSLIRVSYFVTDVSSIKYHLEIPDKAEKILISATSNLAYQE